MLRRTQQGALLDMSYVHCNYAQSRVRCQGDLLTHLTLSGTRRFRCSYAWSLVALAGTHLLSRAKFSVHIDKHGSSSC